MSGFAGYDLQDVTQVRQVLIDLLNDPSIYPDTLKSWVPNWLGVSPPDLNIDQLAGFQELVATNTAVSASVASLSAYTTSSVASLSSSMVSLFRPYSSAINSTESTTITTFGNLTTIGPTISALSAGQYIVLFGHSGFVSTTAGSIGTHMGISVSGAAVNPAYTCSVATPQRSGASFGTVFTVGASGSFQAKYRCTGAGTATFADRWMVALRVP